MRFNYQFARIVLGFVMIALPSVALAQLPVLLHLTSNDSNAYVYADSTYLGLVHESPFWVHPETRFIRLNTVQSASWSVRPVEMTLQSEANDTVFASLNFPMYHQIESHPLKAGVWLQNDLGRRFLGSTPLVYSTWGLRDSTFQVELNGYLSQTIQPKMEIWNHYMASLPPLSDDNSLSSVNSMTPQRRHWIDWGLAIVGVAAGVAAVHYKFRADQINDDYLETGDPSLRPRVARLDDYSGIALGVMQAGIITLAVRFALK